MSASFEVAPGIVHRGRSELPSSPQLQKPPQLVQNPVNAIKYLDPLYLGEGNFASVWRYRKQETNSHVAIKIVDKNRLVKSTDVERQQREIDIHSACHHPNIVKLLRHFDDDKNIYLLLEFCPDGTLLERIRNSDHCHLTAAETFGYTRDVVSALLFLFRKGILHRDLKPDNIFLHGNTAKVGDFGFARSTESTPATPTRSGTPCYLAPEVLRLEERTELSEAWALGCVIFYMLTGYQPFETGDLEKTCNRIHQGGYRWPTSWSGKIQVDFKAVLLVNSLLRHNPRTRRTVSGILTSEFYCIYAEKLQSSEVYQGEAPIQDTVQCCRSVLPASSNPGSVPVGPRDAATPHTAGDHSRDARNFHAKSDRLCCETFHGTVARDNQWAVRQGQPLPGPQHFRESNVTEASPYDAADASPSRTSPATASQKYDGSNEQSSLHKES